MCEGKEIGALKQDEGDEKIRFIGNAIREGAMAFLSREYRLLAIFVVIMAIILGVFIDFNVLDKEQLKSDTDVPGTAIAELWDVGLTKHDGPCVT